jgi:hypothetical protein
VKKIGSKGLNVEDCEVKVRLRHPKVVVEVEDK